MAMAPGSLLGRRKQLYPGILVNHRNSLRRASTRGRQNHAVGRAGLVVDFRLAVVIELENTRRRLHTVAARNASWFVNCGLELCHRGLPGLRGDLNNRIAAARLASPARRRQRSLWMVRSPSLRLRLNAARRLA